MLDRFRLRFTFWLDLNKPEENGIAEAIEELKQQRSFSRVVRDGIRLVVDLSKGKTDVLFELFPWVFDHIYALAVANVQQSGVVPDVVENGIQAQLARLEQLLLEQGNVPVARNPSQVLVPVVEDSDIKDDFELEIVDAGHSADNRSDWNFMIASAMQVQGHCNGLPDEIIRYGLHTKRISLNDVPRWGRQIPKVSHEDRPRSKGGPKAMTVPQFAPPDFGVCQ